MGGVRFWKDRWCGDSSFCGTFSMLYAIADTKDCWVADMWDILAERGSGA